MKYIDDFLEYLSVIKKHSQNTITNYRVDLTEYMDYVNSDIDIDKDKVNSYLKHLYDSNVTRSTSSDDVPTLIYLEYFS